MKKLVLSLVLLVAVVFSVNANNPEDLIYQLSKESTATNVQIGGFLMNLAKPFLLKEAGEGAPIIKGVKSIHVMTVDVNPSGKSRQDYISLINNMKDNDNYQTVIQVIDKGEHVRIMVKTEKDKIKGIYVFTADDHEVTAIKLLGNVSQKELEKMMEKYNQNN